MATKDTDSNADTQAQIAEALKLIAETQAMTAADRPRKFVPYGRQVSRSPFNADVPPGKRKSTLKRICFQNGYRMNERQLSEREIRALNELEAGSYIENLVTVTETQVGPDRVLAISYRSKTPDQRHELDAKGGVKLHDKLEAMIREAAERKAAIKAARQAEINEALR